jgi:RNA polymerase sigma-70 factor (ECF subfamily)
MCEDEKLIARFKSRDISAFDEIFSKYYKPIYYYVYKMLYNSEVAEDITQDTLIKVYKNLSSVDETIKFSSWIYKIAHNSCIDYIRKNKINFELIDNVKYLDKEENEPENKYLNKEMHNKIKKVMLKIGSKYRAILILRDYNDLSYKEISVILGCSESAVKSLIYRARQEFQRTYKGVD